MRHQFMKISLGLILALSLITCKNRKAIIPSFEFAPYISAYTGGIVSGHSSVRIEFNRDIENVEVGQEIEEKLFSFRPALKGKAYWVSNNAIEFVPDSAALKQGTLYTAKFKLGKVMNVEKKLQNFEFSFRVQQKSFSVQLSPIQVKANSVNSVTVKGRIAFNETISLDQVKKMISVKGIHAPEPTLTELTENIVEFEYQNIVKQDKETTMKIIVDGSKVGIDDEQTLTVTIPESGIFKYCSASLIQEAETGIRIVFSEPLSNTMDLTGLIYIEETSAVTFQQSDNTVDVYYSDKNLFENQSENLHLVINSAVRNYNDIALKKGTRLSFALHPQGPAVEFLSNGVILPTCDHLTIAFRAISLQAVDLEVVKIYQDNVLHFLQSNMLSESSELKRCGRLVYKKIVYLNPLEGGENKWNNYSIDLKDLVEQEPGAIYQVKLMFKQDYASAPFNRSKTFEKQSVDGMVTVSDRAIAQEDEAKYDYNGNYYYQDDDYQFDYSKYVWSERNNPYHPTYYMDSRVSVKTNVLASNIGLIVKSNTNNLHWVFVSNILDVKPVSGAEVTFYNYQLQVIGKGHTDANGMAQIKTRAKAFIAVASLGREKTYLRLVDGEDNALSRFDVGGQQSQKGLKGMIYGERGVWRPGDTLHLCFILEDKLNTIPSSHPVTMEVYNARGQFVYKKVNTHSLNGLYYFPIPTQGDAPTGMWNVYVKVGQATFHQSLRVETIKPNRLKIDLKVPDKISANKTVLNLPLQVQWLTGATASGLKTVVEMTLQKTNTTFKGYDNYLFNNPMSSFGSQKSVVYSGSLSDAGKATIPLKLNLSQNMPGILKSTFLTKVFEQGGDVSIVATSTVLSPFTTYVGIDFKNDDLSYIETGVNHIFDIVTLNENGKLVNCSSLEYKIYKIDWSWWWENYDMDYSSYINSSSAKVVEMGQLTTSNGKAKLNFKINDSQWGRYLVLVKDTKGGHLTGGTVMVDNPSWRGRSQRKDPNALKMITFTTDKQQYRIGETATVTIPQIEDGVALVSLETSTEILSSQWVKLEKNADTKYSFEIDEKMTPNVYVHVSVLLPHKKTQNNVPIRMYGVQPVFVANANTLLEPVIICNEAVRPESNFTIKVKEKSGKPMTYTLAIVDEGLLGITNFKTPDPWNHFYAREALGIKTWDMYDFVLGAFSGKFARMFSVGGDQEGGVNNGNNSNRFKPVVRFLGPFALKKGQQANHVIKIPLYSGAIRVMVVAREGTNYGHTEKNVTVKAPLMLLSSLPRVASVYESINLPVNVFAMESTIKNVTVKVQTTGKMKLEGADYQSVTFNKVGDKTVNFKLKTAAVIGKEVITITATANGMTAKEVIEIEVRNPNPMLVIAQNALLKAGQKSDFDYAFAQQKSKENKLTLEVSTLPNFNLSQRYEYLSDYHHYCTEQIVSKAFPLLYQHCFKRLSTIEKQLIDSTVNWAIKALYGRQLSNGAMAYWVEGTQTYEWVSTYAYYFLIMAKEKGYHVNATVLKNLQENQKRAARTWKNNAKSSTRYTYQQNDLQQAFRLYVLALSANADNAAMNRLKEKTSLSLAARWTLAAAYAVDGKKKVANELIATANKKIAPYTSSNTTFGSAIRDEAMIVYTLILLDREKEAFASAINLAKKMKAEDYYTTQSTAFALMAMASLAEKTSGNISATWTVDEVPQTKINTPQSIFVQNINVGRKSGKVGLTNTTKSMIYVNLVSKYRPLVDTMPAINRQLKMEVAYTDKDGKHINVSQLTQGADFFAHIKITNTHPTNTYNDIALTHIIPSGWEIINDRLYETAGKSSPFDYQDIRDDRVLTYFDLHPQRSITVSVHLQASYAGEFQLPAIEAQAMYDGTTYARTKATRTVVKK